MQEIAGKVKDLLRSLLPEAIAGALEDPEKSKSKPRPPSREASADALATDAKEDGAVEKQIEEGEDLARQAAFPNTLMSTGPVQLTSTIHQAPCLM